jgi:23S rRNA (cytidine1920-2'-O)/16S rRNA (cytidine1409-2'-O)-methyltransferase
VEGSVAVDIGSSTGGFSDCLLKRGARKIYAVDVNTRQLDSRLRHDSRVMPVEKNARYLSKDDFDEPPDIVALDVSFISVLKILPAVKDFIGNGWIICLLKPQFEVGRHEVGKKGIVKDPFLHEDALRRILASAEALGLRLGGVMRCSLRGQKGNREFFALWSMTKLALGPMEIEKKIKEAVWDEKSA